MSIRHLSFRFSIIVSVLATWITACSGSYPPDRESSISLAPEFQAFYLVHGGERTLGPSISAAFRTNGVLLQCFVGGCLEYHPQLEPDRRVMLSVLPEEIRHQPTSSTAHGTPDGGIYFPETGFAVLGAFRHFFEAYGAVRLFGYPESQIEVRNEHQLVQYFERAVLVWDMNLRSGEAVQLAPVGSFSFEQYSANNMHSFAPQVDIGEAETVERVKSIVDFAQANGGHRVFGSPIGGPHLGDDGAIEQVYSKAVVFEDSASPYGVSLRPLGRLAYGGVDRSVAPDSNAKSTYYAETGHNVVAAFKTYYDAYGGQQLFGLPISEALILDRALVQYFDNVQMIWQPGQVNTLGVSLQELGSLYASSAETTSHPNLVSAGLLSRVDLNVHTWVRSPFVLAGDIQEINVMVMDSLGQTVADAQVTVEMHTALGVATFVLAPTSANGRSNLLFRAVAGQGNDGMLVTYSTHVSSGDTVAVLIDSFHVLDLD